MKAIVAVSIALQQTTALRHRFIIDTGAPLNCRTQYTEMVTSVSFD
jgi:hypothetical protein